MASAWGSSWGVSWASAWGAAAGGGIVGCFYQANFAQTNFIQPCPVIPTTDKSRALRNLQREGRHTPGLSTEAEYREIALRTERQAHLARLNIAREQLEELKREEATLNAAEARAVPKPKKAKRAAAPVPITALPSAEIEAQRKRIVAQVAQIEATALREAADLRRLDANLVRIELEAAADEDEEDVLILIMMAL